MANFFSPFTWQVTTEVDDTISIAGLTFYRAGIAAKNKEGQEAIGAAADLYASPTVRARFELQERITVFDLYNHATSSSFPLKNLKGHTINQIAYKHVFPHSPKPKQYEYAKTNGIALHKHWKEACLSACYESIERQHLLTSWFGLTEPLKLSTTFPDLLSPLAQHYEIMICKLGQTTVRSLQRDISTVGIALFPKKARTRLLLGFGAHHSEENATEKAIKELIQDIAFSWETDAPTILPEPSPTPSYHGEYYTYPKHQHLIKHWLTGNFYLGTPKENKTLDIQFADLTPEGHPPFYLAKAIHPDLWPLVFGDFDYQIFVKTPTHAHIHPLA